MSELTTVARPYARAAFEFAVEQKSIEGWADMLQFAAYVVENPTIAELLKGKKAAQELASLFIKVCGDQLDKYGQNFIKIMAENERLSVLPRVIELYRELEDEYKKQVDVFVVSAYALSKKQKDELSKSLAKRLARKVNLNCSIDKNLISGMVITAGDLVIDSTAKGQLKRLSNILQA
jgi:F-type H+-transporting ATPase subunit delta